jgi:putative membrane protein (TIGR04086 family)
MNSNSSSSAVDLRAVGMGALWGLAMVGLGAMVQSMATGGTTLSPFMDQAMRYGLQALGGLVGGFMAARRAEGTGWLHGALAGMALILSIGAIMGITTSLPTLAALLKMGGIGAGAGILGGIAGINVGSRP